MTISRVLLLATAIAGAASCNVETTVQPRPSTGPRLVVQLVIDQFRPDYIDRYGPKWKHGLRRLVTEGAYFTEAEYPYAGTVTCAGHASIATGNVPAVHGMMLNEWWSYERNKRVACTEDADAVPVGFTKPLRIGHSARTVRAPIFADLLKAAQPGARTAALSLKPRSAVPLAGSRADAALWFDELGSFATSSAYPEQPWLAAHLKTHPIEARRNAEWTRLLPQSEYTGADAAATERPPAGHDNAFPHRIAGEDRQFYDLWQRSPFSDAYLADLAMVTVDNLRLGQRGATDYLAVSFSALDMVGHKFGPDSHEVQDLLLRLDEAIGRLLVHLDSAVGRDNYVVALSADHGVSEVPEVQNARGTAAGRVPRATIIQTVEDLLDARWGAGTWVSDMLHSDVFLSAAARDRARGDAGAIGAIQARLDALPGVRRAMTHAAFEQARGTSDPMLRAALLSYVPGRSGDFTLLYEEHYIQSADAVTHGTWYPYDRRVPVILFGRPFRAGRIAGPASPLDIAPTWARLTGVALEGTPGRSLDAAFK